jgi:hypothetical protein
MTGGGSHCGGDECGWSFQRALASLPAITCHTGLAKLGANCFDGDYGTQFEIAKDGSMELFYFWGDLDGHRRLVYTKGASST